MFRQETKKRSTLQKSDTNYTDDPRKSALKREEKTYTDRDFTKLMTYVESAREETVQRQMSDN